MQNLDDTIAAGSAANGQSGPVGLGLQPAVTMLPSGALQSIEAAEARSRRGIIGRFQAAAQDRQIAAIAHEVRKGAAKAAGCDALLAIGSEAGHRAIHRIESTGVAAFNTAQTATMQNHHLCLMQVLGAEVVPTTLRVVRKEIEHVSNQ
jgi:hypothetical protein